MSIGNILSVSKYFYHNIVFNVDVINVVLSKCYNRGLKYCSIELFAFKIGKIK